MRITPLALLLLTFLVTGPARADLHITRDHGGYVEDYKAKYARIRDRHERVAAGEMIVVPRGMEHKPFVEHPCEVLLFERRGLVNTGNAAPSARTRQAERIR